MKSYISDENYFCMNMYSLLPFEIELMWLQRPEIPIFVSGEV